MIFQNDLTVVHDDDGTFVEQSSAAFDYGRDTFVLPMVAAEDYLYVGLYKPFQQLYVNLKVASSTSGSFTAEYWDGSTWNNLENFLDLSQQFTRSGFLKWTKPEDDWAKTTVNGDELYWVRFKPSADFSGTTEVQGLNILFADDKDLVNVFSKILDMLGSLTSFVTYHQNARDDIIQAIRNKGNATKDSAKLGALKNISKWDLLDASEVKQGAVYACLANIFFEVSDDVEDKWYQRHKDYLKKSADALELFYLSIDKNDDGKGTSSEVVQTQGVQLIRV